MGNKLFISYAHEDEAYRQGLASHLTSLTRSGDIETWSDRMIRPGEKWNEQIFQNLREANIVLFLISSDFINSDFCYDKEVKLAIEREEQNLLSIIPVIVRSCIWDETPFAKFQALPTAAKPISLWEDKDQAYHDVVKGIRSRLRQNHSPSSPLQEEEEFASDVVNEESTGGFYQSLLSNIANVAKNMAATDKGGQTNNQSKDHKPNKIYGRWRLVQVTQNNINLSIPMMEEVIFHPNHAFQLFQNNFQTNYGQFEFHGNVLNITLSNGMIDSRTYVCQENQLVVYQQIHNVYSFYQRV